MMNEEVDCNSSLDAPLKPEPTQCSHHLRCGLNDGHGTHAGPNDIAREHWAPHGGADQGGTPGDTVMSGVYWTSSASVTGARSLPVDDLKHGERVLDLARKILADPLHDKHVAEVSDIGWVLQHPIIERVEGTMLGCRFATSPTLDHALHRANHGRYVVSDDGDGVWSINPLTSDD